VGGDEEKEGVKPLGAGCQYRFYDFGVQENGQPQKEALTKEEGNEK